MKIRIFSLILNFSKSLFIILENILIYYIKLYGLLKNY
jgi:hypothetical protein